MNTHSNLPETEAATKNKSTWHAAIKLVNDQLDCGEGIACSPESLIDITQSAIAAMYGDRPMDADVLPGA